MTEPSTESANAPRRSSRISAQARPEAPAKRTRKGASNATNNSAKSNKAGTTRKRAKKDGQEGEQDADGVQQEQDAKKVKLPSAEETQAAGNVAAEEPSAAAAEPSSALSDAPKNVDIGESLPSFAVKNEKGEDIDTASLTAEKGVVLFLVPKADTPGCNIQACSFRDVWQEFGALNYGVYCLSADSPAAQTKWQTKKQLPYQLLSDPQRTFIGALGAADGNRTKRSHFVFDKDGKLLDKKIPVKPADSPRLALDFVKGLGN
ncbi:thioredoxin-like protein [Butyriboletus roseoflavus]|nr:thioredoxin-like protein [Butyriboletus roseoflavus]